MSLREVVQRFANREVLTFLAVGGTGYVVDVAVFNLLRSPALLGGSDPLVARSAAVVVAMLVTYVGNRFLTWRHQASDSRRREVLLFGLFNLVGFAFSAACLVISHHLLGLTGAWADNISANVVGVGLGTLFRFVTYRRFVFASPAPPATSTPRRGLVAVRVVLVVAAVGSAFWFVLPRVAGAPWSDVMAGVRAVPYVDIALLSLLWLGGLLLHTFTLTAALPRLTHRRALALSLTGSAIANVLPLGGAAGMALNYRMIRSWGFTPHAFATYTVVTNVWDVLVKLCVPAVALAWLLASGTTVAGTFLTTTLGATLALLVLSSVIVTVLASPTIARHVGAGLDRVVTTVLRYVGSSRAWRPGATIVRLQGDCSTLVARAWPRLTFGMVAYTASLALLLWGCLHVTEAGLAVPAVMAGFAVERLLTLAGLTPGGAGVVEVGLAGLLILLGGAPLGVVAGVLLYRLFTFGLEIPVGGAGIVGWLWNERRTQRQIAVG